MHTAKTIKNSIFSVFGQVLSLLLVFITRRVFICFLDIEYLGYHSLFNNIFSLLSVAELGIGSIISFHLYKEIVNNNTEEIGKLMYLYKKAYQYIASAVFILGIICYFFTPYIIQETTLTSRYIAIIYFMELISIVLGYFLSYRRTLLIANQKEYKCVKYDLIATIVIQILQLITLIIFRNYLLFLALQLSTTIIANIIIWNKTNKEYPYLKKTYNLTKEDIEKRNFVSDIKNLLLHRIGYAVYGGIDNILISMFCGIRFVAIYGNYNAIQGGVINILFNRLLSPIQATIGNIIYDGRSKSDLWEQFKIFDMAGWYFACYTALGFLIFFQPTIELWMGRNYLLPDSFVITYVSTIYFVSVWEIVCKYRCVFGDYKQDRNCMLFSAFINLIISVLLANKYGITGIQFGTLIGYLPIGYGRIRFIVKNYFQESMLKYYAKHFLFMLIFLLEGYVIWTITNDLPIDLWHIIYRTILWLITPAIFNSIFVFHTKDFKGILYYFKEIEKIIAYKIKK